MAEAQNHHNQILLVNNTEQNQLDKTVDINNQLEKFSETTDFKTFVRNAINDESFWNDILRHL